MSFPANTWKVALSAVAMWAFVVGCSAIANAQAAAPQGQTATGKPPYNIVFIIVDQRTYRLLAGPDYSLPGIDAIARHGVRFENHFIATAMCTPSRATFLTGRPPQYHHVIDQMQYSYVPTLDPKIPNVASVLKGLGYKTAYFGKFEMDKENLYPKPTPFRNRAHRQARRVALCEVEQSRPRCAAGPQKQEPREWARVSNQGPAALV